MLEINPVTGWRERWAARLGTELEVFDRVMSTVGAAGEIGTQSLQEIEQRPGAQPSIDRDREDRIATHRIVPVRCHIRTVSCQLML